MMKYAPHLRSRKVQGIILFLVATILGAFFLYLRANQSMPQQTINFLNDVKLPERGQKVLVFSPHPDDETIGAGGYIAMSEERGATVEIVVATDGNKHNLKDKRYEEFKNATSILGVKSENLIFLDHPDGKLDTVGNAILTEEFQQQLESFKPDIVVYPNPKDQHSDHALTGVIAKDVVSSDKIAISYQYLIHYSNYPQPKKLQPDLYLLPPQKLVNFDQEWQRLMLPENIEDQKYEAISSYKTQLKVPVLRSLILSSIRKNELFSIGN